MKNLELLSTQRDVNNLNLNKVEKKPINKINRTNLEKITIAVATAVAVAGITYGAYSLDKNTKQAIANEIIASELGYPQITPRPAPSDPRRVIENSISDSSIVKPEVTPCPTPTETSNLG